MAMIELHFRVNTESELYKQLNDAGIELYATNQSIDVEQARAQRQTSSVYNVREAILLLISKYKKAIRRREDEIKRLDSELRQLYSIFNTCKSAIVQKLQKIEMTQEMRQDTQALLNSLEGRYA